MDYLKELQIIEKQVQDDKIQKAKLEQKLEQLQEEYSKLLSELEVQGVKEEDLPQIITNLEMTIEEEIEQCKTLLK